eukprot:scaffold11332_cov65-Phaeocystis_antarctica.AAC.8
MIHGSDPLTGLTKVLGARARPVAQFASIFSISRVREFAPQIADADCRSSVRAPRASIQRHAGRPACFQAPRRALAASTSRSVITSSHGDAVVHGHHRGGAPVLVDGAAPVAEEAGDVRAPAAPQALRRAAAAAVLRAARSERLGRVSHAAVPHELRRAGGADEQREQMAPPVLVPLLREVEPRHRAAAGSATAGLR